jgi:hypothetical protein
MCQHVPSASVAMPPLFIALRVVFFDAIFAFQTTDSMTPIISALALARVGPVNVFLFMMSFGPRAAKTYRSRAHRLRRGIWIRSTTVISTCGFGSINQLLGDRFFCSMVPHRIHRQAEVSNFAQTCSGLLAMRIHARGLCLASSHGKEMPWKFNQRVCCKE